ncbi:MAG: peptide ABC transporter substrate-binding protein, partial [Chloroflexota bacterium]|nr:peptide ABC transporter substrate-binding protein [Chloroflexota bacterium]
PTSGDPRITLAAGPTAPPGRPGSGGTVTVASPVGPDTLHPWLTESLAAFDILAGMMDGLLRYDATQELRPALAEGFELDDDGLTYTFRLRRGVRYHNGERFRPDDVVAAWETKLDPGFASPTTLGWDRIADVSSPEPDRLVVTTTEPYAPFLSYVGTTFLCPASSVADGLDAFREEFGRAPVGTGPFRLAAWEPGRRASLERFDRAWGDRPRLDRVEYRIVPDLAERLADLRRREIHLLAGAGALTAAEVDAVLGIPGTAVLEQPTQSWQHLDLKQIGFLRETPVRQALDFATPKARIVDELLGGRALPAAADQPPGTWAHDPSLRPRPYDPARAAELLDEAGLRVRADGIRGRTGEPFAIELWAVAGDPLAREIVELIAASWNALGVATTPRFDDPAALWGPMGYQFSDRMTACLYAWTNANDPDDFFYWHSSQIPTSPTAPGGNLPAFFHPYPFQAAIDALTARAAVEIDQDRRRELYRQIQALLLREVPVIFLYWERAFPVAAANLGGFWPNPFTQLLWNAREWYLTDPEAGTPTSATPVAPPGTPAPS